MIDVQVTIDGIILFCDESTENIELGNGYSISKKCLDDLPYKARLVDGNNQLSINYIGSRTFQDEKIYFMCIHKDDIHQIQPPQLHSGAIISAEDTMCDEQLETYKDIEMAFLYKQFSLLKLFKSGNIGYKEIFFTHKFTVMGFVNNTKNQISNNVTRNIVNSEMYTLSPRETNECNAFLRAYEGKEYDLLKDCIEEFIWGTEEIDCATSFEQFTTTLEMILLAKKQQNKKQVLSKRVAVLLGETPNDVGIIYRKIHDFYRYRSESLHEGVSDHITQTEVKELEDITRAVICKYLKICKQNLAQNDNITWQKIKSNKIVDLRSLVSAAIKKGILPKDSNSVIYKLKKIVARIVKKFKN